MAQLDWREKINLKKDKDTIEEFLRKIREQQKSISFNADTHTYFYKGVEMLSVTKRLGFIGGQTLARINPDILQNAQERGTAVHYLTELMDIGDTNNPELEDIHPDLVPYITGYKKFLADHQPNYIGVEQRVAVLDWETAGTIDRIGVHITKDGRVCYTIYDIKTGSHNEKNLMQLHMYGLMLRKVTGVKYTISKKLIYVSNHTYKIKEVI